MHKDVVTGVCVHSQSSTAQLASFSLHLSYPDSRCRDEPWAPCAQAGAERAAFVAAARAARAQPAGAKSEPEAWYAGPHALRVRALEALALDRAEEATRALAVDTLLARPWLL